MNTLTHTDAPPTDTPLAGRLAHLGLLHFAGPDAVSFLQGQVSNDTRPLDGGRPLLAAYSTPQGRVAAVLHLVPHSSGVLAVLPREIVLPTLERLRKYVLRSKVKLEDVSDAFAVIGAHGAEPFGTTELSTPGPQGYVERDGVGVARVGAAADRFWAIGGTRELAACGLLGSGAGDATPNPEFERQWRLADIRAGLPQIYAATREMFVAQMLNMDLVDGISFTKGCFTGQEIIARTQHLGRVKRRMFRLRLPAGTWAIGQAIHLRDGRSGRITEVAQEGSGFEALAVLHLDTASETAAPPTEPASANASAERAAPIDAAELQLPYAVVL